MFTNLLLAVGLTATIGATTPLNTNDGTYYQDVTITETYEYQTNEVNSVDDLVVGNIYKLELNVDNMQSFTTTQQIFCSEIYHLKLDTTNVYQYITIDYLLSSENHKLLVQFTATNVAFQLRDLDNYFVSNYIVINFTDMNSLTCYFVYLSNQYSEFIQYVSASDYLGEKTITITPREYDGFYTQFENFLHERFFSGGELDQIQFTIFNQTMSMGQWLSTTTSIVILFLIISLLIILIKWIFKIVGGAFLWK